MMKYFLGLVIFCFLSCYCFGSAMAESISEDTETCIDCHEMIHPGIVSDWKESRHAKTTPGEGMSVAGLSRKVSSKDVPDNLKGVAVGCAECHLLRPDTHKDTFEHNGYDVHVVVSPRDCATCHREEAAQYDKNLMSRAYGNLVDNPVYDLLVRSIIDKPTYNKDTMSFQPASEETKAEACLYCHGTKLQVTGTETKETDQGDMEFPVIKGWPNQGSGRINPDGSLGACTACHTRHRFSIEMARKPYTCKECHVGPDVPAFKVYSASKHGNIFSAHQKEWDFNSVPWTIGRDFGAPTCATCHISLLVNTEGDVVVKRSHEVKNRLPYRIFGLIYAHPHPKEANTAVIKNKDGLTLPTDFAGGFAEAYLNNESERNTAGEIMQASCRSCHDKSWVDGFWNRFENTLSETNAAIKAATKIMSGHWEREYAKGLAAGGSPFDEFIERTWCDGWLFYANSVRFASAMGGGGDYGVFADGRYALSKNIQELIDWGESRNMVER